MKVPSSQLCWRPLEAILMSQTARPILELRTFFQYVVSRRYMVRLSGKSKYVMCCTAHSKIDQVDFLTSWVVKEPCFSHCLYSVALAARPSPLAID